MTAITPFVPTSAYSRETPLQLSTAARHVAPVTPVESARAIQPVDNTNNPEILRYQTHREVPVGPPPTFDINVLADLRARQAEAARQGWPQEPFEDSLADAEAEDSDGPARAERREPTGLEESRERPERTEVPELSVQAVLLGSDGEAPHALDKKV